MVSVERCHWLALCVDGFELLTDPDNLILIYDSLAVKPDIEQATASKVLRWAVRLSLDNHVSIHITGDDIVWADVVTPWTKPATIRPLVSIALLPFMFVHFQWPTMASIHASQERFRTPSVQCK